MANRAAPQPASGATLRRVLFLCTANYYRSRFCEEAFNHGASSHRLGWHAFSRALGKQPAALNYGPMSPFAVDFLRKRRIRPLNHLRLPLEVTAFDFESSDLVIAVHEPEHRPLVEAAWPEHRAAVGYWRVADVDITPPDVALAQLDERVTTLLRKLADAVPADAQARVAH